MLYIPLARNRVNQSSFSAAQIRPGRNAAGVGGLSFVHCILAGRPGESRHSVFLNIKSVKSKMCCCQIFHSVEIGRRCLSPDDLGATSLRKIMVGWLFNGC